MNYLPPIFSPDENADLRVPPKMLLHDLSLLMLPMFSPPGLKDDILLLEAVLFSSLSTEIELDEAAFLPSLITEEFIKRSS